MGNIGFIHNMTHSKQSVAGFGKMFLTPDEQLDSVPTPESFTLVVELLVRRYELTYFEAIMELCDYYDREYESIKPLLTPKLKVALLEEMSEKRLLKDNTFFQHKLG